MKRTVLILLCIATILSALSLVGCGEKKLIREDGTPYLEGVYIPEGGLVDKTYVFTEEKMILFQIVNTETVELHFEYEISTVNEKTRLILTYTGLVYDGKDPEVAWFLTGIRTNYAKNPTQADSLEIGDGYIVVDGQKLIKQ